MSFFTWFTKNKKPENTHFHVAILGCQRSGTTLLREILHAGSVCMFEENWILSYFARERWHAVGSWHNTSENLSPQQKNWDESVKKFMGNSFDQMFLENRDKRHKFWGIKATGLNMAKTVPYLNSLFGNVKFIVLVRDPRDTFASMKKSPQMMNYLPYDFYNSPVNSPDLVEIYHEPYKYWDRVYSQLGTITEKFKGNVLTVKYEDMLDMPKETVENICKFLNVDFVDQMIEPFCRNISNASVVSMNHADFLNKNFVVSNRAVGRWQKELNNDELNCLMSECSETAKRYGYLL
jgi:hypothetical protein